MYAILFSGCILQPKLKRANLIALTEAYVEKAVLDRVGEDFVARGVKFNYQGSEHIVYCSRDVILSAGSV
jgi:hypothetical protein